MATLNTRLIAQQNYVLVVVKINTHDLVGEAPPPRTEEVNPILVISLSISTPLIPISLTIGQTNLPILLIFQPPQQFNVKLQNNLH